jgi:very-short-patch-repair endonuclease
LRRAASDEEQPIKGLPERLVTEPSWEVSPTNWKPLSARIGASSDSDVATPQDEEILDVFFPKPFNDDQLEIVRRLSRSDGLVVQGPPGTGKTHTIANLICHSMATGQRVLVVSRGEAALAVLKDQLPKEVQPLAIAVLSNEREGLRQIENTIREIQSVIEATQPQNRRTTILRLERELDGLRKRIAEIDRDLDAIALAHLTKIGPRGETPAELAQRIVAERDAFDWFLDRPLRFAEETSLDERRISELFKARIRCGELMDHLDASLPSPLDLPDTELVIRWHNDLIGAAEQSQAAGRGPVRNLRITGENAAQAQSMAQVLDDLTRAYQTAMSVRWIDPFRRAALIGEPNVWSDRLRELIADWTSIEIERAQLLRRSVTLPDGFLENADAREAVGRGATGQKLWSLIAIGKGPAKALLANLRLDGAALRDDDVEGWRHIEAVLASSIRLREVRARWDSFAHEIEAPTGKEAKPAIDLAKGILQICDYARSKSGAFASFVAAAFSLEAIASEPTLCQAIAKQLRASASAVQLAAVENHRRRIVPLFEGEDRTSALARQLVNDVLGKPSVPSDKVAVVWDALLKRLAQLKELAREFATIKDVTDLIVAAGAPQWAKMLRSERATPDDPRTSSAWRDAWDHAAADAQLAQIDSRHRLTKLATERETAEKRCSQLFGEIVRERTFYQLEQRLSPAIRAALVAFVRALTRIGKGTGKSAGTHRRTARDAMAQCYGAIPCWIMPTWRVAEQLPAELATVDLVIIDEASQSDVTELPALMRGKKILVVGDDRQVSPTAPFVTQEKINQLRHHYLGETPFASLLEPGESIYDFMRAVFPDQRLMLKEHFRCVEPIIRFSMQFYPEKMLPLRIPAAHERLDPPLVDIYVPHGSRGKRKKINAAEADVIVEEIAALTARPDMRNRTIGVISLVGAEQADHVRSRLSETIGEEIMQRHSILCGDSATFQGSERDIVFLSMVADSANKTALTMLRYEQRFNVAVSRARDRAILVRSVRREELNPNDLKARLIAHFESPMPELEPIEDALSICESNFERDLMQRLLDRQYRVQGQVGSLGYRIDMVVEGADRRRLAVECDGDRYHGPEQWRQDMRRQRVLERVGWRFWRCFASSFYRDPDGVMNDLFDMLSRMGIEPIGQTEVKRSDRRFTEHRTIEPPKDEPVVSSELDGIDLDELAGTATDSNMTGKDAIGLGDKVVLVFGDDQKRISVRLSEGSNDVEKGRLSVNSALGKAILGAEEGAEVEFMENERQRTVLIDSVEKTSIFTIDPQRARPDKTALAIA